MKNLDYVQNSNKHKKYTPDVSGGSPVGPTNQKYSITKMIKVVQLR